MKVFRYMRNKTVYGIIALFFIQAFSASLVVMPAQNEINLFFPESSDTSARNNSSGGNNTDSNNTDHNNTSGNNTTECTPWNNVDCNDEFGCRAGERIPVLAIDEVTGEVMLDSNGNQIEVWGCSETASVEEEEEPSQIPSIGVLGTFAAICFGFVAVISREQKE